MKPEGKTSSPRIQEHQTLSIRYVSKEDEQGRSLQGRCPLFMPLLAWPVAMGMWVEARGPDSPAQPGVALAEPSNGHPPQLVGADRPPATAHYRGSEAHPAPENDLLGFLQQMQAQTLRSQEQFQEQQRQYQQQQRQQQELLAAMMQKLPSGRPQAGPEEGFSGTAPLSAPPLYRAAAGRRAGRPWGQGQPRGQGWQPRRAGPGFTGSHRMGPTTLC